MRIILEQNKIFFSMTKLETDKIIKNQHQPMEISKGQLMILLEDVSTALLEEWRNDGRKTKNI
jgi:hypothetical protein